MQLYLVMQFVSEGVFEVSGVFSSRDVAIAACRDWTYSVSGPFELDKQLPHESGEHGILSEYPILRAAS